MRSIRTKSSYMLLMPNSVKAAAMFDPTLALDVSGNACDKRRGTWELTNDWLDRNLCAKSRPFLDKICLRRASLFKQGENHTPLPAHYLSRTTSASFPRPSSPAVTPPVSHVPLTLRYGYRRLYKLWPRKSSRGWHYWKCRRRCLGCWREGQKRWQERRLGGR